MIIETYVKDKVLFAWSDKVSSGCPSFVSFSSSDIGEVTEIAATQLGGCTIHYLLSSLADRSTDIEYYPERRCYLEEVQSIIIDEAMMAGH